MATTRQRREHNVFSFSRTMRSFLQAVQAIGRTSIATLSENPQSMVHLRLESVRAASLEKNSPIFFTENRRISAKHLTAPESELTPPPTQKMNYIITIVSDYHPVHLYIYIYILFSCLPLTPVVSATYDVLESAQCSSLFSRVIHSTPA